MSLSDVFTFIGGGVVGSGLTLFGNWLMKKREELMEMLKIISNAAPYYNQLAMNSWNFSWNLTHGESDYRLLMYYMCNILQTRKQVVERFGDLQFDNLEAERIIGDFGRDIFSVIKRKFNAVFSLSRTSPFSLSILLLLWSPCHLTCLICLVLGLEIVKNSPLKASLKFLAPSLIRVLGRFPVISFPFLNSGLMSAVFFVSNTS